MPKIKIDPNRITDLSTKTRNIKNKTGECRTAVGTVISRLDWQVSSKSSINTKLNNVRKRLQKQAELADAYIRALETASDTFCSKDRNLKQDARGIIYALNNIFAILSNLKAAQSKIPYKTDDKLKKTFSISALFGLDKNQPAGKFWWDVLKGAGYLGGVFSLAQGLVKYTIDGNTGASMTGLVKTGISFAKTITKIADGAKKVGKAARMVGAEKAKAMWLKRLLGLNDKMKGAASKAKVSGWFGRFGTNFKKAFKSELDGFNFAKGKVSAALSWAGVAVSGITNWFSNQEEKDRDGISQGRAVAETISETVIDVGKGILIGAAVTAGIAATVGSAPVLAVAAVSAGITIGLDVASNAIFGVGATEVISDAVLGVGTAVIDVGKQVVNTIADAGREAGEAIKDGFNNLVNCFSNPFGKAKAAWGGSW